MQQDSIDRYIASCKRRNQSYVVHFRMESGGDTLEFMDDARNGWERHQIARYWKAYGFEEVAVYECFPGESKLEQTRRLRKKVAFHGEVNHG